MIKRHQKILELYNSSNFYRLDEIASALDISLSTARRDVEALQRLGYLVRTHGGAALVADSVGLPYVFAERKNSMENEKIAIGRLASEMVNVGESIIIDGGTTSFQVARHLLDRDNIQIVTNSQPVVSLLSDKKNIQLISTGGIFHHNAGVYLGTYAQDLLKNVHVSKTFIGVAGISENGFYDNDPMLVDIRRQMMESSSEVYIVADHTKFNRKSMVRICQLSAVKAIITDQMPQDCDDLLEEIADSGLEIISAR